MLNQNLVNKEGKIFIVYELITPLSFFLYRNQHHLLANDWNTTLRTLVVDWNSPDTFIKYHWANGLAPGTEKLKGTSTFFVCVND